MADVTAPQFQQDVNNASEWANGDENKTVTMRLGQQARSPAKVIKDVQQQADAAIIAAANNFNLSPSGFDFATGGTLTSNNQTVEDASGNEWIYTLEIPEGGYIVTAGTTPTEPPYKQVSYNQASNVSDSQGANVQDYINKNLTAFDSVTAMSSYNYSSIPTDSRIEWQGYYYQSDGGSNWGVLKKGDSTSLVDDGGSIFIIVNDAVNGVWVEANLKGKSINPRKFGAAGDGVVNDYAAWKNIADYVNSIGGASIKCSAVSTFLIDEYRTATNGITNFTFQNLDYLEIDLRGSTFDVKGDFNRTAATDRGVSPIAVYNIKNLTIKNVKALGNVAQTTKGVGVGESPGTGIYIQGCEFVTLENLEVLGFSNDGIQITISVIGGVQITTKKLTMKNVVSKFNARNNLSIVAGVQIEMTNCDFDKAGYVDDSFTIGGYGHHLPSAGWWLEPNNDIPVVDEKTNKITCTNVNIRGNYGFQMGSSGSLRAFDTTFTQCTIDNQGVGTEERGVLLSSGDWTFNDTDIILEGVNEPYIDIITNNDDAVIKFNGGKIVSNGCGIHRADDGSEIKELLINGTRLICTKTSKPPQADSSFNASADPKTYFPNLQGLDRKARYTDVYVFIPKEFYSGTGRVYCSVISGTSSNMTFWDSDINNASTSDYLAVLHSTVRGANEYYPLYSVGLRNVAYSVNAWYQNYI